MVSEKDRYIRDSLSKSDKQQGRFDSHGWMIAPEPPKQEQKFKYDSNEMVMCPFCLFMGKLSLFFVSTKKGISEGKAFCPDCKNGMLMRTLLAEMTPEQYAEFVYGYRVSGYWKKCPFEIWKKRLRDIGWSYQFWTKYKELKGAEQSDSIFDDAEKMAKDYGIDVHDI